jgi:hypothetical protein
MSWYILFFTYNNNNNYYYYYNITPQLIDVELDMENYDLISVIVIEGDRIT